MKSVEAKDQQTTIGFEKRFSADVKKTRIPTLHAVLDPYQFGKHLRSVLPAQWGRVLDIELRVIQHHHKSRCVLDIRLQTTTGNYELVGKVYAEDRSDVYQAMKQIRQSGFGPEDEFSIPQPFAFIPELNLLLQEKIFGPLVSEVFLDGSPSECAEAAERCARWLAHFHTQARISGPALNIGPEFFERRVRPLARRAGPEAQKLLDKAAFLWEGLETAAAELDVEGRCACHGTYCHYQIILSHNRVVAVDWDGFCVAHPAFDLARFIIVLRQLALQSRGSLGALDAAVEIFYKTYTAKSSFDASKHLPFYKAAHYLKHAKDNLRIGNGGFEMAGIMLDEGLRILKEEIGNGRQFHAAGFNRTVRPESFQRSRRQRPKVARASTPPTVLNTDDWHRYLNPVLPPDWGILSNIQITGLKQVHGRCRTVNIILQTTSGTYELVGKIYRTDRSDVYRAMKQISEAGFGPGEEFSIPQPFAFIPELNLLLQEKVEGPMITEIFLRGDEQDRARAAERCASWLVHFQKLAPPSGPPFVLRPIERWTKRLRKAPGSLQNKARLLARRLEMVALTFDHTKKCPSHGDYTHHQICCSETRTSAFDWDDCCVADPAWDVARFIGSLQMLSLESLNSIRALDAAIDVFYRTYTTGSRFQLGRQFPFHKSAYCLKRAGHFLKLGSNEKTEAMLDEGLRILAEEYDPFTSKPIRRGGGQS